MLMKGMRTLDNNKFKAFSPELMDYGAEPTVVNIDRLAKLNPFYRVALWTGKHLQVTLMSIKPGEDIGLEMHSDIDQFIRVESGNAIVKMGKCKDMLNYQKQIDSNYAVMIPAGTWHNIINVGKYPLKLYSVYAPVKHPFGTIHKTKKDAEQSELY